MTIGTYLKTTAVTATVCITAINGGAIEAVMLSTGIFLGICLAVSETR